MDEYYLMVRTAHFPTAFGTWHSGHYLNFTECFDPARQAGLLPYTSYNYQEEQDDDCGDLYVTGDLYQNDIVPSAVTIVPRHMSEPKRHNADAKQGNKKSRWGGEPDEVNEFWPHCNAPSPVKAAKPVDEDLYRISPALLHKNNINKKRGFGFFASCCIVPTCFT